MTRLSPESIAARLTTQRFGRTLEYLPQTGSTNDVARERARAGAPEGVLVVADEQLSGRGRRGRTWAAPPGSAILASVVLRPRTPLAEAFAPTMIFALAVQAAARAWGAPAGLKWPNDVLCRDRKLAGILCEMTLTGGVAEFAVAGFGVNVDLEPDALGLGGVATSLRQEIAGPLPTREEVLADILAEAEARYTCWQTGGYAAIWAEWRDALTTLGSYVRIDPGDGALIEGTALHVAPDGALLVRTAAGEQAVIAGTVLF